MDKTAEQMKWLRFLTIWEYGRCRGKEARRNKITGEVQFILWKAGEHGHKKDFWYAFDSTWWFLFEK